MRLVGLWMLRGHRSDAYQSLIARRPNFCRGAIWFDSHWHSIGRQSDGHIGPIADFWLKVPSFRRPLCPSIVSAIDDGHRRGEQSVYQQIVERRDLDHHITYREFRQLGRALNLNHDPLFRGF